MPLVSEPDVKVRSALRQEVVKRAASARSACAAATSTAPSAAIVPSRAAVSTRAQARGQARDPKPALGERRACAASRSASGSARGAQVREPLGQAVAVDRPASGPRARGRRGCRPARRAALSSSTGVIRRSSSLAQRGQRDRLGEVAVHAGRAAAFDVLGRRVGGEREDRHLGVARADLRARPRSPPITGMRRSSRTASNAAAGDGLDGGLAVARPASAATPRRSSCMPIRRRSAASSSATSTLARRQRGRGRRSPDGRGLAGFAAAARA